MRIAVASSLLLVVALNAPALAIPGQSTAQLAAWGKSNPTLRGFKPTIDDYTGGTTYIASLTIDGHNSQFNSQTKGGRARAESIELLDVPDTWDLAKHLTLVNDAIRTIYGPQYVEDFKNAVRLPHKGRVTAWQGKRLAYATFGQAIFVYRAIDVPFIAKNMQQCDALDCSEGDVEKLPRQMRFLRD